MIEEEIDEGDWEPPIRKVFLFQILSDLKAAVPHRRRESNALERYTSRPS